MVPTVCRSSERITTQDALWGLVLLGLLMAQAFGQPAIPQPGHGLPLNHHHPELPAQFILHLLVSGQFERLGSFLFGLGFYQGWGQIRLARLNAGHIARHLLLMMLGIGLGLSLLLGSVDLLCKYALLGLTLLYFMNQSVASLLKWLVGLIGLVILVPGSVALLDPGGMTPHTMLSGPSFKDWLLASHSVSRGFAATISYELMLLGGLLVGKLGLLSPNTQLRVRLSLLQIGVLPLAFLCKGAWVALSLGLVALPGRLLGYQPLLLSLCGFWGALLLTVVYLLELGVNSRWGSQRWVSWPARIGQLSLTNYLIQSILYPLLLYGYGQADSGLPPVWGRAILVMGIYGFQLGFSWLWTKRYRLGPLEWLFRQWLRR
ncbi:DUF418 domain-containing protein [Spirosoma koreense]